MSFWESKPDDDGVEVSATSVKETTIDDGLRTLVIDSSSSKDAALEQGIMKRREAKQIGHLTVKDHFSLHNPSSTVTFSGDETLVFVDNFEQVTLNKNKDSNVIVAKQAAVSSPGLLFTRFAYTVVAFLMAGLVFVFCIQIVLFLFLGLAIESGLTSQKDFGWFTFFGTMLSLPVFISALSQIMVIANTFVLDTWRGSKFMKTVTSWDSTLVDWLTLFVFFAFPLIIGAISLYTGTGEWWTITSISWFTLVLVYYVVFAMAAVYYEIDGCLELVRYHPKLRSIHNPDSNERSMTTFTRAAVLRMKQQLSGYQTVSFIAQGTDPNPTHMTLEEIKRKDGYSSFIGPISWLTRTCLMSKFYTVLDEPVRQYSVDEVLEFSPFVTRSSWGLESIYCRSRNSRFIAIIDGNSALTKTQVIGSFFCFAFGTLLTLFAIVGMLVWLHVPAGGIAVIIFVYLMSVYGNAKKSVGLRQTYRGILRNEDNTTRSVKRTAPSNGIYLCQETFRITEPKVSSYWIVLGLQIILFFLFPICALFASGNNKVGLIFICLGIISTVRNIFNAPSVLRELGSLEGIEINNEDDDDGLSEWREKHRLGKIISEISAGKRSSAWTAVFLFFVLAFCAVFLAAVALGSNGGVSDPMTFAPKDKFYYPGSGALNYASCSMGRNIQSPGGTNAHSLADFVLMGNAAYLTDDEATSALEDWFGDIAVENLSTNVTEFKQVHQETHGSSSVSYKLFSFPGQNGDDLEIVSIRGTSNAWDALTDAQLWSSAALSQYVRAILPLGELWTPILAYLVKAISTIEDKALEDVSYYKETSAFVKSLKEKGRKVQIVGHSLGGGLAMITAAQNEIPGIGVSGPNNMISRKTFNPPISVEALNMYTFNIVPDRDPVPRIDDLAQNYQRVQCRAPANRPVDCHYSKRTLCEILLTCGSSSERPIPCYCVHDYGYDVPVAVYDGDSFYDYCPVPSNV